MSEIANSPAQQAGGRLSIDLDALAANYQVIADKAAPARCSAVVKANA
ncbi:MAG: alanine racemase, partial [Gammaproteobacteria bacterium]